MYAPRNSPALDSNTLSEFQYLSSKLKAWVSVDHNEDGTHHVPVLPEAVPLGAILMWGAAAAPSKWLLCDGAAVSRATYQGLFAVIGTTYGAGDGSTTFNLPDLRQRFPLGKAASGTGATLGATGGAIDHTHAGGVTGSGGATSTGAGGSGATTPPNETVLVVSTGGDVFVATAGHLHNGPDHTHAVGDHTHTTGTTGAANPPYVTLQFIILAGV